LTTKLNCPTLGTVDGMAISARVVNLL
jgi:hypothetical protein